MRNIPIFCHVKSCLVVTRGFKMSPWTFDVSDSIYPTCIYSERLHRSVNDKNALTWERHQGMIKRLVCILSRPYRVNRQDISCSSSIGSSRRQLILFIPQISFSSCNFKPHVAKISASVFLTRRLPHATFYKPRCFQATGRDLFFFSLTFLLSIGIFHPWEADVS